MGSKSVKGLDRTAVLNVERTAVPTYCEVYLAAPHDVVQEGIDSVKLQNEEWRVSLRSLATFICKTICKISASRYISNTHMYCT